MIVGLGQVVGAGNAIVVVLYNGDIVACTSIRDKTLVAGNIREKLLLIELGRVGLFLSGIGILIVMS